MHAFEGVSGRSVIYKNAWTCRGVYTVRIVYEWCCVYDLDEQRSFEDSFFMTWPLGNVIYFATFHNLDFHLLLRIFICQSRLRLLMLPT